MIEYNYISGNKILITEKTQLANPYTWEKSGLYESKLVERFFDKIRDGFTVLDIGAQSGAFSLGAKFYPTTQWYAFEPDPANAQLLIDNLALNEVHNVTVKKIALSSRKSCQKLNVCTEHKGLNTLGDNLIRFDASKCEAVEVDVDTIDNLFHNQEINLIKIDTEGSEYDILVGGQETIKKFKPHILLEYNDENLKQCHKTKAELDVLIDELGYKIARKKIGENIWIVPKRRFF